MKKILIVEDEKSLREVLRDKLTREGFSVTEASNGEEGLARALEEQPDLILLDIVMPKMNGLTLLKELRKDPRGKETKVIILTNLNDTSEVSLAIERGSMDYLVKTDWKLEDLVRKIRGYLGE